KGEWKGDLSNEIRGTARPESVDHTVDHRLDDGRLPTCERLSGERTLEQASVRVVLRLVHFQNRPAEDVSHDIAVDRRREARAVPQDLLDGLEAHRSNGVVTDV